MPTYVFIDASNIRAACQRTLGIRINFARLLVYLRRKYPNLQEARYYEGISSGDLNRARAFKQLEYQGYVVCSLSRQAYTKRTLDKYIVDCPNCGYKWARQLSGGNKVLKSNVDVYLASEFMLVAARAKDPIHLVLFSCDGDYAEMIRCAIENNRGLHISVVATPYLGQSPLNMLSSKLMKLRKEIVRYSLQNIGDFIDEIRQ